MGLHIYSDPRPLPYPLLCRWKATVGILHQAFQGYKTGRRGGRIVKVTQSAAKVVTGVSVSLSCVERGTRLRCGLLNIYCMSPGKRHVVCSIKRLQHLYLRAIQSRDTIIRGTYSFYFDSEVSI